MFDPGDPRTRLTRAEYLRELAQLSRDAQAEDVRKQGDALSRQIDLRLEQAIAAQGTLSDLPDRTVEVWDGGEALWSDGAIVVVRGDHAMSRSRVEPGFELIGPGTIRRAEGTGNGFRTLVIPGTAASDAVSRMEGVTFDGQRPDGYEHDQAHLVMLGYHPLAQSVSQTHRIEVVDCAFIDAHADGLYLAGVSGTVRGCRFSGSGRAGVSLTHTSDLLVEECTGDGFNHELESPSPWAGSLVMRDCRWGAMKATAQGGGRLLLDRVNCTPSLRDNPTSLMQVNGQIAPGLLAARRAHSAAKTLADRAESAGDPDLDELRAVQAAALVDLLAARGARQIATESSMAVDCDWSLASHVTIYQPSAITLERVRLSEQGKYAAHLRIQDRYRWPPNQRVTMRDCTFDRPILGWGNYRLEFAGCTGPIDGPWIEYDLSANDPAPMVIVHDGATYVITGDRGTWRPA